MWYKGTMEVRQRLTVDMRATGYNFLKNGMIAKK